MSELEDILIDQLTAAHLPTPVREYVFHPRRRWRVDFAYLSEKIAIEVEGGLYSWTVKCHNCHSVVMIKTKAGRFIPLQVGGGHSTGQGLEDDIEKYNQLSLDGWLLVRVSAHMIKPPKRSKKPAKPTAVEAIRAALEVRGWEGV